jgi:hypothetical protein
MLAPKRLLEMLSRFVSKAYHVASLSQSACASLSMACSRACYAVYTCLRCHLFP